MRTHQHIFLFTMSNSAGAVRALSLASSPHHRVAPDTETSFRSTIGRVGPVALDTRKLVEADGIEPTTPCLQSRCSPTELRPRLGRPDMRGRAKLVGPGRFELPTSRLSSARSNQLSYEPDCSFMRICRKGCAGGGEVREPKFSRMFVLADRSIGGRAGWLSGIAPDCRNQGTAILKT